jgi:hypothetical protein
VASRIQYVSRPQRRNRNGGADVTCFEKQYRQASRLALKGNRQSSRTCAYDANVKDLLA